MTPAELQAAGWEARECGGFTSELGTIWQRGRDADREVGFLVDARHANIHLGTCHGGALMTFADAALSFSVADALGSSNCVTAQLQTCFVSAAKVGEFVSCRPELVRRTSQLVFIRGLVCVGERTVVSADGIWKVLEPKSQD